MEIELKMDHCGLQHIFTQGDLNAQKQCWSELLCEYDFKIYDKKDSEHSGGCVESENMHIFGD
jgi:hypothetical protein